MRGAVSVATLCVAGAVALACPTAAPAQVDATGSIADCGDGSRTVRVEVGEPLRFRADVRNRDDRNVGFNIRFGTNRLTGATRTSSTFTVRPGGSASFTRRKDTDLTMLINITKTIRITLLAKKSDGDRETLDTCDVKLTLTPPVDIPNLIQVPVRMCVLEGGLQGEGQPPPRRVNGRLQVSTASGNRIRGILRQANSRTWVKFAQVAWAFAGSRVPVIADPEPVGGRGNASGSRLERTEIERTCDAAWRAEFNVLNGVLVTVAIRIADTVGFTDSPPTEYMLATPGRPEGQGILCTSPRSGVEEEVVRRAGNVVVTDPANDREAGHTLAHELGHALLLGHGNGIDDDGNGLLPPNPGARRYDEYCDPAGFDGDASPPAPVEDRNTPDVGADNRIICQDRGASLMRIIGRCDLLKPLQVEAARDVASLIGRTFP
jgi:hypothetical protein